MSIVHWTFVVFIIMPEILQTLFWSEINLIQSRHSLFFPDEQKKYITLKKIDSRFELAFLVGYDLPRVITQEIQLAFKLFTS